MSTREISHWACLPRPPQTVWDFITSADHWNQWWWGDDELTEVDPGWEEGARLVFSSDWAPTLEKFSPPKRLAFGGHTFDLSDAGDGTTRFEWTYSRETRAVDTFDYVFSVEEEVDGQLQTELEIALRCLAEALEVSAAHILLQSASGQEEPERLPHVGSRQHASNREVRVFVSSTFRDMSVERDELTRRIFLQLRKLCEQRGVVWGDVDLRWGITDEQKEGGEVLKLCLKEIHRCRPYFIGLLGERYGWIPDEISQELVDREPWLDEYRHRSMTEMEILHGVLNNPEMENHAFFYFRNPAHIDSLPTKEQKDYREQPFKDEAEDLGAAQAQRLCEERKRKLVALKERIRASGFPVREGYEDPQELGERVLEDLTEVIDRLFPEDSVPDPLDREAADHQAFAASRCGVYIERDEYFDRLDEHAQGDGGPLVVLGDSGSGKSALLANWAERYRQEHPEECLILHFIGASPHSADWMGMLRRILGELYRRFAIKLEIPDQPVALRQAFANTLHMTAAKGRVVLILDALNQLEDRDQAPELVWLPPVIPANIRLILSTLPGRPLDNLKQREWPTMRIKPFTPEERQRFIKDYLAQYAKLLGKKHADQITEAAQAKNPLFLRVLLEELRLHGDHFTLGQKIDEYLSARTVVALYQNVLGRYEQDYERGRPGLVRETTSLLWAARRGLSEAELLGMLGSDGDPLPHAYWSPLHLAAEQALVNRSGLIGFGHDYLRQAVEELYLADEEARQAAHRSLADYFASQDAGPRRLDELPWQLSRSHAWDELASLLADLDFLTEAWQVDEYDVRRYWAEIEHHSALRMNDVYGEAIQRPLVLRDLTWTLASLLHTAGYWAEALDLRRALTDEARSSGNLGDLVTSLGNQAHLLKATGKWDQALDLFGEQEDAARRVERNSGLAAALCGQALIHLDRGRLELALKLFQKEERVHRKAGDRLGLQFCLGNQALVLVEQSDLSRAMELRQQQERICREIGQVDGLRICIEAQSVIRRMRQDLEGALILNRDAERICRELGDRSGLSTTLANQGVILQEQGDLRQALRLYRETEKICRDLGERQDLSVALNNQASILSGLGEIKKAMSLFEEVEAICRSLGYAIGLQACLHNQGQILLQHGDTGEALRRLEEGEAICRDMNYPLGLAQCLNLKGAALNLQGREEEARPVLKEARDLVEEYGLRRK